MDAAELRHVAVADWHTPRHAGVEVVIHAHGEAAVLLGGAHHRARLRGVAVPRVVDPIRVADGLDLAVAQVGQLPAGPGVGGGEVTGVRSEVSAIQKLTGIMLSVSWGLMAYKTDTLSD